MSLTISRIKNGTKMVNVPCTKNSPLCMFMSGVGGTEKSFLIHTIRAMVNDLWKDKHESVRCALAAPTGLAAFNIDGVTVHRLFQLPIEHDRKHPPIGLFLKKM